MSALSPLRRAAILITLAVLGAGSGPALAYQPAYALPDLMPRGFRSPASGYSGTTTPVGRRNASISVAQGKRNARKARNVVRNRRAHR